MTDPNRAEKRVTCKRPHPNLHLLELLKSLYKEAVDVGSPYVPSLKLAISSLEKYPLPLNAGSECAILKGFDAKLCGYIDLHIKEISDSKKSKLNDKADPNNVVEISSTSEESCSDSEMAFDSKKNPKNDNNYQVTNAATNANTKSKVNDKVDPNNKVEIFSKESSSDPRMTSDSKKNPKKDNYCQVRNAATNANTKSKVNDKVDSNNKVEIFSKESSSDPRMTSDSKKNPKKDNCQVRNAATNANTKSKVNDKVNPKNEVEISSKESSSDSRMASDSKKNPKKDNCQVKNAASHANTKSKVNDKVDPNNEVEISSKESSSDSRIASDSMKNPKKDNYQVRNAATNANTKSKVDDKVESNKPEEASSDSEMTSDSNSASNANTKSKANKKIDPNNKVEISSKSGEKRSVSEMASDSKKNPNMKNVQVTNTASNAKTSQSADKDTQSDDANAENPTTSSASNGENSQQTHNGEQNNNVDKSLYVDNRKEADEDLELGLYLHSYFVNRNNRVPENEACRPLFLTEKMQKDCFHQANLAFSQNWESLNEDKAKKLKNKCETQIKNCYIADQVVDISEDSSSDEPVTEINSSSDEEIADRPKQSECRHQEEVVYCRQCELITAAANAFESYYKEKLKKDAEEIEKCVLPRKIFVPNYRSGAYAILIALLEQRYECPYRLVLTKDELILKAQKHTDHPFTSPDHKTNYNAWTNVNRLISKGLIQMKECKHRGEDVYMLTTMGRAIAIELSGLQDPKVTVNDIIYHGLRNDRVPSLDDIVLMPPPPFVTLNEDENSLFIEMPPGTFDIVMLIDKRENFKIKMPANPDNYYKYESRSLNIGDFLWVARSKKTGQEIVLPYIVERKRIDDLSSSIKDGRYDEQKFRLRKCGLSNVLYLVESSKAQVTSAMLPPASLMQAIVNTSVMDDFNIIKTESLDHTFKFLGMLSESLVHEYSPIFLKGSNTNTHGRELMTFDYFNKHSSKNRPLTVKDTFIKMLLQLKGLSVEKALAITKVYNSPKSLMKAYARKSPRDGEMLLANLKFNNFTQNVGPTISKTLYKLFSTLEI